MTFKSKRRIVALLAGLVMAVCYTIFALSAKAPAGTDIRAWAIAILKLIGIGIGSNIVLQILFHIAYSIGISVKEGVKKGVNGEDVNDEEVKRLINVTVVEDEMDKAIELKASRFGYMGFGVGFMIALFVLANGLPIVWALHSQLAAAMIGYLLEGIVSIFLYERGM